MKFIIFIAISVLLISLVFPLVTKPKCSPLQTATVTAVITGPDTAPTNRILLLDSRGSYGQYMAWQTYPADLRPRLITGLKRQDQSEVLCFCPCGFKGDVLFFLCVSDNDKIATTVKKVTFSDDPLPNPPTPTPPLPTPGPNPTPNPYPLPDDQSTRLLAPVASVLLTSTSQTKRDDATRLAAFYAETLANHVADPSKVATTADLRTANVALGTAAFASTGIKGRYPGLAQAIDDVFIQSFGLQVHGLDEPCNPLRALAVARCKHIAWAITEGASK